MGSINIFKPLSFFSSKQCRWLTPAKLTFFPWNFLGMLRIKPGAAWSRSKYSDHCAMRNTSNVLSPKAKKTRLNCQFCSNKQDDVLAKMGRGNKLVADAKFQKFKWASQTHLIVASSFRFFMKNCKNNSFAEFFFFFWKKWKNSKIKLVFRFQVLALKSTISSKQVFALSLSISLSQPLFSPGVKKINPFYW